MPYQQLTDKARCVIHALHKLPGSLHYFVDEVGCHKSTVSRELKRHSGQRGYRPKQACL
jgi:IS30 family transposase